MSNKMKNVGQKIKFSLQIWLKSWKKFHCSKKKGTKDCAELGTCSYLTIFYQIKKIVLLCSFCLVNVTGSGVCYFKLAAWLVQKYAVNLL